MSDGLYDVIIVGGGTAGCLLANRLSADSHRRVLLVEAGGHDDYHWIHIPLGALHCTGNPRTDWLDATEPEPGLNGRSLRLPRGKVLGGCSSIDGMLYLRGQSRDYDGWASITGDANWRWEHCLPYFKRHEDHWRGADALHGRGKEWRVERQRQRWDILDAFAAAAREAGIAASDDFNRGSNEGVGYFEVNQKAGLRWNASKAFLRPVVARPNLQVWTGATTTRVLVEGARAVGIEVLPAGGGAPLRPRAAQDVVLAAGAIGTPLILQRSGIGPATLLQQHGIAVLRDLPGVGENLQDHLQIGAVFAVEGAKTLNTEARSVFGKAKMGLDYLLRRSGPMGMAPSPLGVFTRSSPAFAWPNVACTVQPWSQDAAGQPLHGFDAFTASVCNLNPGARGHVRIRSAQPQDAPRIQANHLSTAQDRQVAIDALRLARRIAAMPALARFRPSEVRPGAQHQSDDALARMAGDAATASLHAAGTCSMGADGDPRAVVDARLRVRGVAGLRIADASVMPTITSSGTTAPTLMIAERAAEWVAQAAGKH